MRAYGDMRAVAPCHGARASHHAYTIVGSSPSARKRPPSRPSTLPLAMSPFWIWTQIAIVVFVVIGMIVAITKLA
jgi:hypothetical protein